MKKYTIKKKFFPSGLVMLNYMRTIAVAVVLSGLLFGCATTDNIRSMPAQAMYAEGMAAYNDANYVEAEKYFKGIMEEHPLNSLAVDAQLLLGDVYFLMDRYEDGAVFYTNFAAMHPSHNRAPYALYQKGLCHFNRILSLDRDQTDTKKSLFAFQDLVAAYPDSQYGAKARDLILFLNHRLAEREFYVAKFYYKDGNYKGALARLRDLLKNYPDVGLTDQVLYYIGESYTQLGEKKLAIDAYTTLVKNYPDSPFTPDARDRILES